MSSCFLHSFILIIPDLQFTLAMQAEAAKNEEQLKETIKKLKDEVKKKIFF